MWKAVFAVSEWIIKKIQYKTRMEAKLDTVLSRQDDLERRTLRLELLSAMDRGDTAVVHQLYDEYRAMNGNSYCVALYNTYFKTINKKKE